jgi:farnesyl-diphosphate farnesyltransferase
MNHSLAQLAQAQPADVELCKRLLPQVSRTFALSIEMLPEPLSSAVRTAYLLCRIVDTIEDSAEVPLTTREALFDAFDALMRDPAEDPTHFERLALALPDPDKPDVVLCRRAGAAFRAYRALHPSQQAHIQGPVLEMSQGMRRYAQRQAADPQGRLHIHDIPDLEEYCYYVAGTVGKLLTPLFLQHCPEAQGLAPLLREREVPFGLGLQLVNILKDVADDAPRNVSFLPQDHCYELGLTDVLDPDQRPRALQLLHTLVDLAQSHLDRAAEYTALWPAPAAAPVRLFTMVPLLLAVGTLRLLSQAGPTVWVHGENPKVSRRFVSEVVRRSQEAAHNPEAFERLLQDVRTGALPTH